MNKLISFWKISKKFNKKSTIVLFNGDAINVELGLKGRFVFKKK